MVKKQIKNTIEALPKQHKVLISGLVFLVVSLSVIPTDPASASRNSATPELEPGIRHSLTLNEFESEPVQLTDQQPDSSDTNW